MTLCSSHSSTTCSCCGDGLLAVSLHRFLHQASWGLQQCRNLHCLLLLLVLHLLLLLLWVFAASKACAHVQPILLLLPLCLLWAFCLLHPVSRKLLG